MIDTTQLSTDVARHLSEVRASARNLAACYRMHGRMSGISESSRDYYLWLAREQDDIVASLDDQIAGLVEVDTAS